MCVQYIGACSVHQRDTITTSEGYHKYISVDVQYIGDIVMHVERYHEYIGGCSVHQGMFSTSGDTMSTSGGYHEYIRGCSVHRQSKLIRVFQVLLKTPMY